MVCTEIGVISLVKHVQKVFEKCPRRVEEWRNNQKENGQSRAPFPFHVLPDGARG